MATIYAALDKATAVRRTIPSRDLPSQRGGPSPPRVSAPPPTLRGGHDRFPTVCRGCNGRLLTYEPPLATERFGLVTCSHCGEVCAYVRAPRQASTAAPVATDQPPPARARLPVATGPRARMTRLAGCSILCTTAGHDPLVHEAYGRRQAELAAAASGPQVVTTGNLTVDLATPRALVDGQDVKLSRIEADILARLARALGHLVTHRELLASVWGRDYSDAPASFPPAEMTRDAHILRVNVTRLRAKLGDEAALVRTVKGRGLVLVGASVPDQQA